MSVVIGVTGANGYIGDAIIKAVKKRGWSAVALGRQIFDRDVELRRMDLNIPPSAALLEGLDAVIHLAANTHGVSSYSDAEINFASTLMVRAKDKGILVVFASSQTAAPSAPSDYGRTKFAIEQIITQGGGVSIRPGLVVGGSPRGLFGLLLSLCRQSFWLPDFRPRPLVQPVHVADLAECFLRVIERPNLRGTVLAVAGRPVPLVQYLEGLSFYRLGVSRVAAIVPTSVAKVALYIANPVFGPRFSPDRLNSLLQLPSLHPEEHLGSLGMQLRSLACTQTKSGSETRVLLTEGFCFMRALMGRHPSPLIARRYVRTLEAFGFTEALNLPIKLLASPVLLASLDSLPFRLSAKPGDLAWRMNVAYRLAETDPASTASFLFTKEHSGPIRACAGLIRGAWREFACLLSMRRARHLLRSAAL